MMPRSLVFLINLLLCLCLQAQDELNSITDSAGAFRGLFDSDEPLYMELKYDIRTFQRTRRKEEYQPAELKCVVNDSLHSICPVRVKARGIYRRDYCTVPPFWLNIRYSGIEAVELEGIRRMKMVIRCRDARQYEDYVLREYLVYRIYNLITPCSFRVRLVWLKLIDTGRKNREREDWAFLIEPEELMATRLDAEVIDNDRLSMRRVNRDIMDRLAMFQYMIGNGDYSVTGMHNLKILMINNPGPAGYIPVPYDFDYTGLVNTHYAIPGETLGISHVRERYFLGPCRGRMLYQAAIEDLQSYRDEIMELILAFPYLDENEKMDMVAYIQEFYNKAAEEKFIEWYVEPTCR